MQVQRTQAGNIWTSYLVGQNTWMAYMVDNCRASLSSPMQLCFPRVFARMGWPSQFSAGIDLRYRAHRNTKQNQKIFFVIGWEVGLLNWISGVLPKKNPRCICTSSECWPKCADYPNLVHALTCSKGLKYIQVIFSHWVYSLELCESNIFMGAVKFRVFPHEQFPLHCTLSKYNQ